MFVQKHQYQDTRPLIADHYRRHRKQLADKGTTKKPHAISTKNNIKGIKKRWKKYIPPNNISFIIKLSDFRYYKLMIKDLLAFLQHCTKEDIITFLNWILDYYHVRKKSSFYKYWRVWRILYRRYIGRSLYAKIAADINNIRTLFFKEQFLADRL
jgi:hypothetical protein